MRKSILSSCLLVLTFTLFNYTAFAQIKIPKIFKPKENPTTQTPTTSNPPTQQDVSQTNNQPSTTSGGSYIDDGFTWFEAVSFQDFVNNAPVTAGWALKSSIRLVGEFPDRSAFKMVVARAGKPIATARCEGYSNRVGANGVGVSFVWTVECWKKETATKEIGKFDVQVFAINGSTDAETLVRTYKIDVRTVDRVNGQTGKFSAPDAPHYYISRHAEAPVSFLFLRPRLALSYVGSGDRSQTKDINTVEIYYNLSPTKEGKSVPNSYLTRTGPTRYACC